MRGKIDQCGTAHEIAEHLQQSQTKDDNGDGAGAFWSELVGVDDDHGKHDDRRQQPVEKSAQYLFRHFETVYRSLVWAAKIRNYRTQIKKNVFLPFHKKSGL